MEDNEVKMTSFFRLWGWGATAFIIALVVVATIEVCAMFAAKWEWGYFVAALFNIPIVGGFIMLPVWFGLIAVGVFINDRIVNAQKAP
jgi:hypothetical protein